MKENRRYTSAEVAQAADLEITTVEDWAQRGLIEVADPPMYTWQEALQFAIAAALVRHGLPVYRACEIATFARVKGWSRELVARCAKGEAESVYVFVVQMTGAAPGIYQVHVNTNPEADVSALFKYYSAKDSASLLEYYRSKREKIGLTVEPNYNRVAVYDVGRDLIPAVKALSPDAA